jgi:hypothetical protein|tara:strand:+ start:336 stop:515 length:180 start_codon:yes stop_codon:yes gene_type:complete
MDNQLGQVLDDVIVKEMTIDLSSGSFYKEVDDETLGMALRAMYGCIDQWEQRGIIIGRS